MALPKNAHVSTHPCLQAKLSQLRSASTGCRDAQTLVHEIALMVGYEALGSALKAQEAGTVRPHIVQSPNPTLSPVPKVWGKLPTASLTTQTQCNTETLVYYTKKQKMTTK